MSFIQYNSITKKYDLWLLLRLLTKQKLTLVGSCSGKIWRVYFHLTYPLISSKYLTESLTVQLLILDATLKLWVNSFNYSSSKCRISQLLKRMWFKTNEFQKFTNGELSFTGEDIRDHRFVILKGAVILFRLPQIFAFRHSSLFTS